MNSTMPLSKRSPQERWQAFSNAKLPKLSQRQKWGGVTGISVFVALLIVFILPYILPLTGPDAIALAKLADPDGTFVEINNQQLYYVHLAGDGETVLLLHGQGGSTLTWRETLPTLQAAGYDVYALDLPGMGLSQKGLELDYSHPAIAETVAAFLDSQGIEKVDLVAHAFSGNIATQLALSYPNRVNKLVLVAPTLFYTPTAEVPQFLFDLGFLKRWSQVLLQLVLPEAVGEQLRSATKKDEVVTDQLIDDYSRILHTHDWDLSVIGMLRDSSHNALSDPIQTINTPVLLLWGSGDGWATPNSADGMLRDFPDARLVKFEGVGHLPMHEVPADFNAALIEFLDN